MMVRLTVMSLVGLVMLCLPALASAEKATLTAESVVLIEDPSDETFRALLKFTGFSRLEGKEIYSAKLILPHISVESPVRLVAHPVITAWDSSTVSWTSPWEDDGGDYDSDVRSVYDVYPGRDSGRQIWLNVTEYVRSIADGESDYGLMMFPPTSVDGGFAPSIDVLFETPTQIRIGVVYAESDS
jgi:hypothetical protein